MKFRVKITFLFCLFVFVGCGPAIDSPKSYDNNTLKFSYPGNWEIQDSGSMIVVQEKLVFGMIDGETTVQLSIDDIVSSPPKYEHIREVETKIMDKKVKGQLNFDWLEGVFQTKYFLEKDDHSVRVLVEGTNQALKASEPGVRLVLESLELL